MGKSIYDTLDALFVYVSIMGDISAGSGYYTMMVAIYYVQKVESWLKMPQFEI